ncbi:MAG: hypothetical protein ABI333_03870 [bacterium]
MVAVAACTLDEVVDEGARRRAEPGPGCGGRQVVEVGLEARLGLGRRGRPVQTLGRVGQLVCKLTEDVGVPPDAPGGARLVPGWLEGLAQRIK